MVLGIATEIGSRTSHTAIMARSLNIPAVVGLKEATEHLKNGDNVLLDGNKGFVIINPRDQTLWEDGELEMQLEEVEETLGRLRETPSITKDGKAIILSANIWVGVCGEMAGEVTLAPLLVGLGIDELSASPGLIPGVKKTLQSLDSKECARLVEDLRRSSSPSEIFGRCEAIARASYRDEPQSPNGDRE
jgi:phosphoenolpyruvate-protein kinase (PTS system EI component)